MPKGEKLCQMLRKCVKTRKCMQKADKGCKKPQKCVKP